MTPVCWYNWGFQRWSYNTFRTIWRVQGFPHQTFGLPCGGLSRPIFKLSLKTGDLEIPDPCKKQNQPLFLKGPVIRRGVLSFDCEIVGWMNESQPYRTWWTYQHGKFKQVPPDVHPFFCCVSDSPGATLGQVFYMWNPGAMGKPVKFRDNTRWWLQLCFIVIPTWGNDPIWIRY